MSRSFTRLLLALLVLISGEVGAIGLGDIKLDSALNEPLRAEIQLLSASAEELDALTVTLASEETFARYGIDRPFYLQGIEFNTQNGIVQLRSRAPITEPFLTFLVEATWPSGRLLREYTVLLDPPTFAPPAVQQSPAVVSAPQQSRTSDSGQIQRQATPAPAPARQPPAQPQSSPSPRAASVPAPQAARDDSPYDTVAGGDVVIGKGDTLWGVASRMRPDSRLSMNQTMLAIYEANPDAFGGNINVLKAGASLRIPSADEVFRISRGDALSEVQRHNNAWDGGASSAAAVEPSSRPSLTLVPPDDEPADSTYDDSASYEPISREQEVENRIAELEAADVPDQQSLIEVRDNELAALRQELANLRGEVYEPPVDETLVDDAFIDESSVDDAVADETDAETNIDNMFPDEDELTAGDDLDAAAVDDVAEVQAEDPVTTVRTSRSEEKGIVDQLLDFVMGTVGKIVLGSLVVVAGLLFWFMRRGDSDEDDSGPWEQLDADDLPTGSISATESMKAPTPDEAILVVEQDSGVHPIVDDTIETQAADASEDSSGSFGSLEDTFSSETAVNLDQTDPIAEADFHMAYGLYDQAADLINGALETDPSDKGLMSKLCEIYFVWGNHDAFVEAATRLKSAVGEAGSAEWDKIVIMGQQIAAEHHLFAGAELAGAADAVDLAFEDDGSDATGALDMDFGSGGDAGSEVVDLGAADETQEGVDFLFDSDGDASSVDLDLEPTAESPTIESPANEETAEMPSADASSTIEDQFGVFGDGTSELPSLDSSLGGAISASGQGADATAEMNLDDLDLDIDGLAETELASLDDLDATGQNEALVDLADVTGKNLEIDPDDTGVREVLGGGDFVDLDATGEMRLAPDETGKNPMVDAESEHATTGVDLDESLLDATGLTQVLSDDLVVDTGTDISSKLTDDEATLMASMDDDADDFDFAKTEALPPEAFTGNQNLDETAESQTIGSTDVDLDLDDLTAALQSSSVGDTVEQPRDDATVEQPRPSIGEETSAVPTMELAPDELSDDLHEARTMTEVGTKLDLARAYVDMGDPAGARSILEEVLDEGDDGQKQQAQQLLDSLPS